jgi:hypothetical protein
VKRKQIHLSTLKNPDETKTKDKADTLQHMLEHFTAEDNNEDADHRRARLQSQLPISTAEEKSSPQHKLETQYEAWGTKKPEVKTVSRARYIKTPLKYSLDT